MTGVQTCALPIFALLMGSLTIWADPEYPNAARRFRSPVLLKVLAAMLHAFWKMEPGTIGNARQRSNDVTVNIRILAIPASFVSPSTFINYMILIIFSSQSRYVTRKFLAS